MAITKAKKHNNSAVKAIRGPFGIHYAKLVTKRKGKFIQWLSQADYKAIIKLNGYTGQSYTKTSVDDIL